MRDKDLRFLDLSVEFVSILLIAAHQYKRDQNCRTYCIFYMSSEETSTEDSIGSRSEVNSLNDDFVRMHFESTSSDEDITEDEVDSNV
jgi:hypothetical protein